MNQGAMSRYLGLDVGSKTIGLALSDELGVAAYPLEKLMRRGTQADVEAVVGRARDAGVTRIVVGLPLSLDGAVGPRARRVLDRRTADLAGLGLVRDHLHDLLRLQLGAQVSEQDGADRAAHRALTRDDLLQCRPQLLAELGLEHIAVGAGLERAEHVLAIVE